MHSTSTKDSQSPLTGTRVRKRMRLIRRADALYKKSSTRFGMGILHAARREGDDQSLGNALRFVDLTKLEDAAALYREASVLGGHHGVSYGEELGLRHLHSLFLLGRYEELLPAFRVWYGRGMEPIALSGFIAVALKNQGMRRESHGWAQRMLELGVADADALWVLGLRKSADGGEGETEEVVAALHDTDPAILELEQAEPAQERVAPQPLQMQASSARGRPMPPGIAIASVIFGLLVAICGWLLSVLARTPWTWALYVVGGVMFILSFFLVLVGLSWARHATDRRRPVDEVAPPADPEYLIDETGTY